MKNEVDNAAPQTEDNSNQDKQTFESIKHRDHNKELWFARELLPVLDYATWSSFEEVIKKAQKACQLSGINVEEHFGHSVKMVKRGANATRPIPDFKLSRYACYLIVQNADSSKPVVAQAQTYFAMQSRRQELQDEVNNPLTEDERRLKLRQEITDHNKSLVSAAHAAGVNEDKEYSDFHNQGYAGLYGGLNAKDIHQRKVLKPNEKILDFMGSTELAANYFRATVTEDKLRRENIQGADNAIQTHFKVGQTIRNTIKELGGTMPEDLEKPEKGIQEIAPPPAKKIKMAKK